MRLIAAGRLDQRVTLQAKSVTRDAFGAEVVTWADTATMWASVDPLSGREGLALRAARADITIRFVIRYRAGVTPSHRIVWRGTAYNITEVIESVRKTELSLLAYAEAVPT